MATVKTAISLPADTFAAVTAAAAEKNISRSALVLEAIQEYLRRAEGQELTRRLNLAYGDDLSADDQAWIDDTLERQLLRLREEDGGWPRDG